MFGGGWKEAAEFFILFYSFRMFCWLLLTRTGAVWVCQDCLAQMSSICCRNEDRQKDFRKGTL